MVSIFSKNLSLLINTQKRQISQSIKAYDLPLKKWLNLAALLVCVMCSGQTNYTNYFLKNNSSKTYYNPALYQTNSYVEHFDFLSECVQINTNINYTDLIQKWIWRVDRFIGSKHPSIYFKTRSNWISRFESRAQLLHNGHWCKLQTSCTQKKTKAIH